MDACGLDRLPVDFFGFVKSSWMRRSLLRISPSVSARFRAMISAFSRIRGSSVSSSSLLACSRVCLNPRSPADLRFKCCCSNFLNGSLGTRREIAGKWHRHRSSPKRRGLPCTEGTPRSPYLRGRRPITTTGVDTREHYFRLQRNKHTSPTL